MSHQAVDPATLDGMEIDALREVGNIGAGNAAQALSSMLGVTIDMSVPSARAVAIEKVPEEVGDELALVAAAHLRVHGDAPGEMVFLMSLEAAQRLTNLLLAQIGAPPEEPLEAGLTEMQMSALQELSNVLTGSYLNALSQMTNMRLEPTPPALGVDLAGALLSAVVSEVALTTDVALLIETALSDGSVEHTGTERFIFMPSAEGLAEVLRGLGLRP